MAPSVTVSGALSPNRTLSWNKTCWVKTTPPFRRVLPWVAYGTALLLHIEPDGKKIFSRRELH